jgi:hypothetical protein
MFRHGILHSKTRDTVASTGWTHPLSGAFYKYKGPDLQYFKPVAGVQDTSTAKTTPYRGQHTFVIAQARRLKLNLNPL